VGKIDQVVQARKRVRKNQIKITFIDKEKKKVVKRYIRGGKGGEEPMVRRKRGERRKTAVYTP